MKFNIIFPLLEEQLKGNELMDLIQEKWSHFFQLARKKQNSDMFQMLTNVKYMSRAPAKGRYGNEEVHMKEYSPKPFINRINSYFN